MPTVTLSPLDQSSQREYINFLLCFPLTLDDQTSSSDVRTHIQQGFDALSVTYPFLKGTIRLKESSSEPAGLVEIAYHPESPAPKIESNLLNERFPTFEDITLNKVSVCEFDGRLCQPPSSAPSEHTPTFVLRANFVRGGLLLCVTAHHAAFDATGVDVLVRLLARCCSSKSDEFEVDSRSNDRSPLFFGGSLDEQAERDRNYHRTIAAQTNVENMDAAKSARENRDPVDTRGKPRPTSSRIFSFSAQSLARLKAIALLFLPPGVPWISTQDALAALIWLCVCRAQSPNLPNDTTCTLNISVNGRSRMEPPLPATYLGVCVFGAVTQMKLHDLLSSEGDNESFAQRISSLAAQIRSSLNTVNVERIRSTVQWVLSQEDVRSVHTSVDSLVVGNYLYLTSWADLSLYNADFGDLLKKPTLVRLLNQEADGLGVILPRRSDGSLEITLRMFADSMERLENDSLWNLYCHLVC
ncbi:hypothetical protein LTR66_006253 [Elasticomyces elasticus]|nr:hypothetical protein LTR66_006253 [Elasticomyces elasticus]